MKMYIAGQCDIDARNVFGQTPVMRAVFNDNQEVVKLLVKAGVYTFPS
jgi:ankyrin repeat protein